MMSATKWRDVSVAVLSAAVMFGLGGAVGAYHAEIVGYKRGYAEGHRVGATETMERLSIMALKNEIQRQEQEREWTKEGRLPAVEMPKFFINRSSK